MSHDNPSLASALKTGKLPALDCECINALCACECVFVRYCKVYSTIKIEYRPVPRGFQ